MSRVIITRHSNNEPEAVAGWDEPLNSYFFQVFDDTGEIVFDVGANRPSDIRSLALLRQKAGEYERLLTLQVTQKLKRARANQDQTTESDLTAL